MTLPWSCRQIRPGGDKNCEQFRYDGYSPTRNTKYEDVGPEISRPRREKLPKFRDADQEALQPNCDQTLPEWRTRAPLKGFVWLHATSRHSLNFYNNVAVSAFYSQSTGVSLGVLRGLVHRALSDVIEDHAALAACVVDEGTTSPYFVRLPQIDLEKSVRFIASRLIQNGSQPIAIKELDQLLEEEHNQNFKSLNGVLPMWRVLIVHEPEPCSRFVVTFVYHHAICDGTSGLVFHRSFLTKLQKAARSPDSDRSTVDSIVRPSNKMLIPCLEDLHPLPISLRYLFKSLYSEFVAHPPRGLWTSIPITVDQSKRRSRYRSLYFSKDTTSSLIVICRSHRTSVTAAVQAMLAAAVLAELPADKYSTLRVDGAVSLRQWLPHDVVDEDSIGNWVSRYLEEHRRPNSSTTDAAALFSWDEARRIRATIEGELRKEGKDSHVALLRFAGNLHNFFRSKIGKPRDESFEFSNVGVFKTAPDQGDGLGPSWEIGKVVFSQSADVAGAPLEASLVTGADGHLNIGFSWLEGVVDGNWVERVMDSLGRLIRDSAN
ncbi:hypothetical protein LTR84_011374 [Exophiala bonariae]|uniref:Alcohol acetyltransferase n=1 Tax=Exophiala bonariae TaxID=1690606 RepID=A0AAV9MUZ9_9EURO|nr:hypothetical protein LTR84_011374 [Exophiala bonariae]